MSNDNSDETAITEDQQKQFEHALGLGDNSEIKADWDRMQKRCAMIDDLAARELKLLEGVEGPEAVTRRHVIRAQQNVRHGLETWQFETPVPSGELQLDVLFSVAADLICSALLGVMHKTGPERAALFFSGMEGIMKHAIRKKLIPPAPTPLRPSSVLDAAGTPFKRKH